MQATKQTKTLLLAAMLLLASPQLAIAQASCGSGNPAPAADELWDALADPDAEQCRRQRATGELNRLALPEADPAQSRRLATAFWRALEDQWRDAAASAQPPLSELYAALEDRAGLAADALATGTADATADVALAQAWQLDFNGRLGVIADGAQILAPSISIEARLVEACRNEGTECPRTFRTANVLLEDVMLASSIGAVLGRPTIVGLADRVAQINDDWDRFLFDSKPMYPWSLWLTDLLNRNDPAYGEGLFEPPDTQYFLLHPAPGFSYVDDAIDGDQLAPSVYVEVFGINKWRARYLTGASLIVEFADRGGVDDVGYGALFTFRNKYSIAVTARDGDVGITLGVDLANFYREQLKPQIAEIRSSMR